MILLSRILNRDLSFILLLYLVSSCLLFPHFEYFIDSPDALQYVNIAQKYSTGNFKEAVNSFWSPLFSWLLSCFLLTGMNPFIAAKIIQLLIGGVAIIGIDRILVKCNSRFTYFIIMAAIVIFILCCAFLVLTPDLLFLSLCIWYAYLLQNKKFYSGKHYPIWIIGILGALLFFSKSIGFVFFLSSFTIFCFYIFKKNIAPVKQIVKTFCIVMIVFLGISSIWIYFISAKENHFTVSSSASYNSQNIGPASNPDVFAEVRHPYSWQGFIKPFGETALCAWEEPHKFHLDRWDPFLNTNDFIHYLHVIGKNLISIQSFYFGLDSGTVLLTAILVLWFFNRKYVKSFFAHNMCFIILCFCCTFPYILLLVIDRYLWINNIIIAVAGFSVFQKLMTSNKYITIPLMIVFFALFVKNPLTDFLKYSSEHKNIFQEEQLLSDFVSGKTASVYTAGENPDEHYTKSSLVSFFSHSQYFGMMRVPVKDKILADELKKNQIKYLMAWESSYEIPDSMYSDVATFPKSRVLIYKLK